MMNIQVHESSEEEEGVVFPDCGHTFALNSLFFLKPWYTYRK